MRKMFCLLTVLMFLAVSALPALADGDLFIYNWSDYTAPDLLKKFEAETGIKVTLDIYDSNETLLAKLKSGGGNYDIIVPSNNFIEIMVDEGLIQKVNAKELKGYENIVTAMQGPPWDPNNEYTIPWNYGSTSFCLNTSIVNPAELSLGLLFEPPAALHGKISMFDSSEENTMLAAIYRGYPLCSESPEEMQDLLNLMLAQKPYVKVYSSEGIHERLVSGDAYISGCWNGSAMRARKVNPDIMYVYPKEGIAGWADNLAVPSGSQNVANAKKFMEFMLQPENAAIQTNFSGYSNAIKGSDAFLSDDLRGAPELTVPEGIPVHFTPNCSEAGIRLRDKVWTKIKQ